jgi:hypothetical protein
LTAHDQPTPNLERQHRQRSGGNQQHAAEEDMRLSAEALRAAKTWEIRTLMLTATAP